jgi:hypothetical protein
MNRGLITGIGRPRAKTPKRARVGTAGMTGSARGFVGRLLRERSGARPRCPAGRSRSCGNAWAAGLGACAGGGEGGPSGRRRRSATAVPRPSGRAGSKVMDPHRVQRHGSVAARGSGVAAPPLPLGQRIESGLGRRLVREGLDQARPNGAGPTPAPHQIDPAEQRRLKGERVEPPHAPVRVDPAQVDEVGTGLRHRAMLPARKRKGNPARTWLRLG